MWVELVVAGADGFEVLSSGKIDSHEELPAGIFRLGAVAGALNGEVTHKPWEVTQFLYNRVVAPKGTQTEWYSVEVPIDVPGPISIRARLLYRIASPATLALAMGEDAFIPTIAEVATASVVRPIGLPLE